MTKKKIGKYTIKPAVLNDAMRKSVMADVAKAYLTKQAAQSKIEDFETFVGTVRDDPSKYETITEKEREFYDLSRTVSVWVAVAGCVKPYITIDEWRGLEDAQVTDISTAAMEINPHWFEVPKTPEQEKKTDETQSEYITDSVT